MNGVNGRSPARILVVDDDPTLRLLAREALSRSGFAVSEAADGAEALSLFQESRPQIVLLDVKMPGMDGFTVCSKLRELPGGRHVPVLMMTGLNDIESIERAYQSGATDFVIKPVHWIILGHRISYMLRASTSFEELRESQAKLSNAQRIAGLGYWEWSPARDELLWSDEMYAILGLDPAAQPPGFEAFLHRVHGDDRPAVERFFKELLNDTEAPELEFRIARPDRSERFIQQQVEILLDDQGKPLRVTGTIQDVTERKTAEQKIRFLAYYDGLTGLPNRRSFLERLNLAIAQSQRRNSKLAVLFLDLDRFKRINDTLGHAAGDSLLQQAADRLLRCVRATDLVGRGAPGELSHLICRFGGDEFVVLLSDISNVQDAARVARRLSRALTSSFELAGQTVFITTSIGITLYPYDGEDAESLIKNADTAMYHAKDQGGNNYQYYNETMNATALERLLLETSMSKAIERREFELSYQPQLDMETGRIVGVEALVRWQHPEMGLIRPGRFIGLAEETGLIFSLGDWVLETACRQARKWSDAGLPEVRMAVNLSSRQFTQHGFAEHLSKILDAAGLEARRLDLEITESVLMQEGGGTIQRLNDLKAMGMRISIDDFGTGYSSLSYLRRFPVDALKIDRSFLKGIPGDRDHVAITRAVIAMARSLRLEVVAEGVETEEQLGFLRGEGCREMQGFLLGRPQGAEEIARRLAQRAEPAPRMKAG